MTTVTCSRCGMRFSVAPHLYGKRVACTSCGGPLDIPDPMRVDPFAEPAVLASLAGPGPETGPGHFPKPAQSVPPSRSNLPVILACVGGACAVVLLIAVLGVSLLWRAIRDRPIAARQAVPRATLPPPDSNRQFTNAAPVKPPVVPKRFVFRPTFVTREGTASAGQAFLVNLPEKPYPLVLTAVHLLGPAGGLDRDLPGVEIPRAVQQVILEECFDPSIEIDIGGHALLIPSVAPLGEPSIAGDMAAFWVAGAPNVVSLPLASADPAVGELIWLAGPVIDGAPADQRLHAARVLAFEDQNLYYTYDNAQIELRATSGAPVLNARGEVVAINLGGGMLDGGLIGVGNPVSRFRPHLLRAAANPPALDAGPDDASALASNATPPATAPRTPGAVPPGIRPPPIPPAPPSVAPPDRFPGRRPPVAPPSFAPPSFGPPTEDREPSLEERQSIYREIQLIGLTFRNGMEARERSHQRMLESMKTRPNEQMLENMNRMRETVKEQLTKSHERSIESLCQRRRITLDQLQSIIDEGDREGWTGGGARPVGESLRDS